MYHSDSESENEDSENKKSKVSNGESNGITTDSDSDSDSDEEDAGGEKRNKKRVKLTPYELAVGEMIVNSKEAKSLLIDESYNR